MMLVSGTHLSAELTEAMRIKCLAQGHDMLMQPVLEHPISVSRNRHLTHTTNMLQSNYIVDVQDQLCHLLKQAQL